MTEEHTKCDTAATVDHESSSNLIDMIVKTEINHPFSHREFKNRRAARKSERSRRTAQRRIRKQRTGKC